MGRVKQFARSNQTEQGSVAAAPLGGGPQSAERSGDRPRKQGAQERWSQIDGHQECEACLACGLQVATKPRHHDHQRHPKLCMNQQPLLLVLLLMLLMLLMLMLLLVVVLLLH